MKKITNFFKKIRFETLVVFLTAIVCVAFYFTYTSSENLDEKTTWTNVIIGQERPDISIGKSHSYYIVGSNWLVFRKEKNKWVEKGYIYELSDGGIKRETSTSQQVYTLYKTVVKQKLRYDYNGTGEDWLRDLCQKRLYSRQILTVRFESEDDGLLEIKHCYLRDSVVYEGNIPEKEGYVFSGWDKSLFNIYEDIVVRPTFKKIGG